VLAVTLKKKVGTKPWPAHMAEHAFACGSVKVLSTRPSPPPTYPASSPSARIMSSAYTEKPSPTAVGAGVGQEGALRVAVVALTWTCVIERERMDGWVTRSRPYKHAYIQAYIETFCFFHIHSIAFLSDMLNHITHAPSWGPLC
jgi:hypothetical protein